MGDFIKRMVICGVVAFFSIMCSIGSFSNLSKSQFKPSSEIPTYCESPLSIVEPFGMEETDEHFIYHGSIANSSNQDILIETLYFTYNLRGRNIRTDGYINLVVPANGVLNVYEEKTIAFYGNVYNEDYTYVKVKINGKEDYLMHSDYNTILSEYQESISEELEKFETSQNATLFMAIILSIFAIASIGFGVYYIIKRDDYIY